MLSRPLHFRWADTISEPEWENYRSAIRAISRTGVPFMLGGGFALATFTGRWRDTKDIDFYVHPRDREKVIAALSAAGFEDYYSRAPYDRRWIHRNIRDEVIVDIIWAMANQRAQVDDKWFERTNEVTIRGETLQVLPMEELMWCKLYIMQRDHCDWPDIFNLLYAHGPHLDWQHLIARLDEDVPLLTAVLTVFSWLCPRKTRKLPGLLKRKLSLPALPILRGRRDHIHLLDTRQWFGAAAPPGKKLEV